jgi:hypothetical protein
MIDFLSFKTFIAPYFFIAFYYMGAIFMPILIIYKRVYLQQKIPFLDNLCKMALSFFNNLSNKRKIQSVLFVVLSFIMMEIMWRVGFEFIIGYFRIVQGELN